MTSYSFPEFFPNEIANEIRERSQQIPSTLFHYTDGGAIMGIVDKKELWDLRPIHE